MTLFLKRLFCRHEALLKLPVHSEYHHWVNDQLQSVTCPYCEKTIIIRLIPKSKD